LLRCVFLSLHDALPIFEGLLRRKNWSRITNSATGEHARPDVDSQDSFRFDDKTIDFQNLQLRSGSNIVQLTVMESDLLRYLIRKDRKSTRLNSSHGSSS